MEEVCSNVLCPPFEPHLAPISDKAYKANKACILFTMLLIQTIQTFIIYLGMGDQIKRYCEKLEPEEYEELLDNEVKKRI